MRKFLIYPLEQGGRKYIAAEEHKTQREESNVNIMNYKLERKDLLVATAIDAYLKNMIPEARKEQLGRIIHKVGEANVIEGEELATLIESAKAAAMIGTEAFGDGEDIYQKSIEYIRSTLPTIDGREYVKDIPRELARFLWDWAQEG